MATNSVTAQAMCIVLARFPPFGYAQVTADILVAGNRASGQGLAAVVKFAKQNGFAQSNARITGVIQGFGQALARIT